MSDQNMAPLCDIFFLRHSRKGENKQIIAQTQCDAVGESRSSAPSRSHTAVGLHSLPARPPLMLAHVHALAEINLFFAHC